MHSPALHPANDVRTRHGPGLPSNFTTAYKDHQGGDAAYTKLGCNVLRRLGIQFRQTHAGLELLRSLRKMRCHRFAWTAPRRPKIHYDRDITAINVAPECRAGELYRLSGKLAPMASATFRVFLQARRRSAVNRAAVRADDVHNVSHEISMLDCGAGADLFDSAESRSAN
jgi:hypothetical protein